MTKHFIDHTDHISRQTFSAAVIVDSNGKQAGKIIIRFTPSQIGYNHQVGVLFHPADMSFEVALKGSTYSQPQTLADLFSGAGVRMYDWTGREIIAGWKDKEGAVCAQSLSRFDDIASIKHGRKQYSVLWAI